MLYVFFWVIFKWTHPYPVTLLSNWLKLFLSQTFSHMDTPTILKFLSLFTFLPVKTEQIECSEMSAYKIQTSGNYPEENIQVISLLRNFLLHSVVASLRPNDSSLQRVLKHSYSMGILWVS
jgi:hypothetical protein